MTCTETEPDACELLERLGEVREFVATEFDALLHNGRAPVAKPAAAGCKGCGTPKAIDSDTFLEGLPDELAARVKPWREQARINMMRDDSKVRLARPIHCAATAGN